MAVASTDLSTERTSASGPHLYPWRMRMGGVGGRVGKEIGRQVAPKVVQAAPGVTSRAVLEALDRAIDGVGPLPPAAQSAEKRRAQTDGDVDDAVKAVIENHVRLAGVQGFLTNLGGLATAAVAMPTNAVGLAILQCRMIAAIAHLRGYSLDDPRVRNAILAAMLGHETVSDLVKRKKLAGPPMALATAGAVDPSLKHQLATEVGAFLVSKVAGKRLVTFAGRRVPVVGGVVGAGADGYSTWRAGRYAAAEFLPRNRP